jgi:hypothetical protein
MDKFAYAMFAASELQPPHAAAQTRLCNPFRQARVGYPVLRGRPGLNRVNRVLVCEQISLEIRARSLYPYTDRRSARATNSLLHPAPNSNVKSE